MNEDQAIFLGLPLRHVQKLSRVNSTRRHKPFCSLSYLLCPSNSVCPCSHHSSCTAKICSQVDSSLGFPNVLKGQGPLLWYMSAALPSLTWRFISYRMKVCKAWLWPKWPGVNHGEISGPQVPHLSNEDIKVWGEEPTCKSLDEVPTWSRPSALCLSPSRLMPCPEHHGVLPARWESYPVKYLGLLVV